MAVCGNDGRREQSVLHQTDRQVGSEALKWIERQLEVDPPMRGLLDGVWRGRMTPEVWARVQAIRGRNGSWAGHIGKYQDRQRELSKLINRAKAIFCPYNPEAATWIGRPPPTCPAS